MNHEQSDIMRLAMLLTDEQRAEIRRTSTAVFFNNVTFLCKAAGEIQPTAHRLAQLDERALKFRIGEVVELIESLKAIGERAESLLKQLKEDTLQ